MYRDRLRQKVIRIIRKYDVNQLFTNYEQRYKFLKKYAHPHCCRWAYPDKLKNKLIYGQRFPHG